MVRKYLKRHGMKGSYDHLVGKVITRQRMNWSRQVCRHRGWDNEWVEWKESIGDAWGYDKMIVRVDGNEVVVADCDRIVTKPSWFGGVFELDYVLKVLGEV